MEKVLITGANGFIGSHILEILRNSRFKIFATDINENSETKTKINWIKADLGDKKETENLIKTVKADYLLHLAWNINTKMKKDEEEQNRWVDISMNLVDLFACNGGKRVIIAGTCMEYDWNKPVLTEEQTTLNPQNIYGKYKNMLYQKFSTYCHKNNVSYVWGRIFYLFGPRQDKNRIVPYVINSILKGNEVLRVTARKDQWGESIEWICNECRFETKNVNDWTVDGATRISQKSVISANHYESLTKLKLDISKQQKQLASKKK